MVSCSGSVLSYIFDIFVLIFVIDSPDHDECRMCFLYSHLCCYFEVTVVYAELLAEASF